MKNKQEIARIFSSCTVSQRDIINMQSDQLEAYRRRELAYRLSEFILKNYETLPIEHKVEFDNIAHSPDQTHTIRVNIISDKELSRLKRIECAYYELLSNYNVVD